MKYRLTEDWLEYKTGEVIECDRYVPTNSALTFRYNLESRTNVTSVSATELSLLLKTGILEEMKESTMCTRENGCGLPFIQGRECYDGELCEDVRVKSQHDKEVKEEEWPEDGEDYWIVDTEGRATNCCWENDYIDGNRKKFGNVFHSETAALEASEQIKTLLLSLKK